MLSICELSICELSIYELMILKVQLPCTVWQYHVKLIVCSYPLQCRPDAGWLVHAGFLVALITGSCRQVALQHSAT